MPARGPRLGLEDLLFYGNELVAFLGIAGNGEAGQGQFDTECEFDGGAYDGVIPEDHLFTIGILGINSYTDSGLCIGGQLWATEEACPARDGIGLLCEVNLLDDAPFYHEVEARVLELFFEAEDLIEGAGVFRVGLLETQG
jgi:hypothetical protein